MYCTVPAPGLEHPGIDPSSSSGSSGSSNSNSSLAPLLPLAPSGSGWQYRIPVHGEPLPDWSRGDCGSAVSDAMHKLLCISCTKCTMQYWFVGAPLFPSATRFLVPHLPQLGLHMAIPSFCLPFPRPRFTLSLHSLEPSFGGGYSMLLLCALPSPQ